ncbi:MAG TPA: hypothetical protein VEY30_00160, partial [Myxococcaceae bacterium]|nr:hypothetical protein [Myxococcaceae bacterium]
MRHWKIILVVALVLGAIGFRLVQNKNTVEERTRRAAPRDLPVTVAAVGEDELVRELQLTGSIDAAHEVVVASETQGRVLAVGAEVGD